MYWKESPTCTFIRKPTRWSFERIFTTLQDAQLLHEKGEMKNAEVARDTVILPVCITVKDLAKGTTSSETRRIEIKYSCRSGESLSLYASLKFFSGAPKFLARQTPFLFLLRAARGTIIFHLRYRAPSLARVEKTDVAASSREWKITGDNKFYEEAPFPAESPFRPAIRFVDKIADKNGDCRENSEALSSNEVRIYFNKNPFSFVR